jgi:hypothetical protein
MANTFELIASSTVGAGGVASINFTSIASTFTDLVVKYSLRDSQSGYAYGGMIIKFNSSSSGYTERVVYGTGSSAASATNSGSYFALEYVVQGSATASTFANGEIYVPNYLSSNNKSMSADTVTENNAAGAVAGLTAGLWSNSAAITSISLAPTGGTFVQYSTAYLYGVKNA